MTWFLLILYIASTVFSIRIGMLIERGRVKKQINRRKYS